MAKAIPIEEVARIPRPGWAVPGAAQFRPDGKLISYLHSPEGGLVRQLYALDPHSGERYLLAQPPGEGVREENLSMEEKLRRERARMHELGVTSYAWSPKGDRLLLPFPDGLYIQDGARGAEPRKIVDAADGPLIDPRFAPDGRWIAFVRGGELWVVSADGGTPVQVTKPGEGESDRTRGLAEYIAQEEMDRRRGFWWSPDSSMLAFEEVDETHIPVYRILHQGQGSTGEGAQEDHRYPFAGQANARVRLGVTSREGGKAVWMDLGEDEDFYLARVSWLPDGRLAAQITNRAQDALELRSFDPHSGQSTLLLREENSVWINLHNIFHPIKKGALAGSFIWASEVSRCGGSGGYRHLYLHNAQGECLGALTEGYWMVDGLAGVDEANGVVYFTSTKESPLESHLYAVDLRLPASEPRRITQEAGTHQVVLDPGCKQFIDNFNAVDSPPSLTLRSLEDGALLATIYENDDPRLEQLDLDPPEMVTLKSRDGVVLYGAVYCPAGTGPFPTLVSVYGGPHAQMVANNWRMTSDLRAQYLRQQGFLVFVLDNRGSARRGLEFEGAIRHKLGDVEVRDQVDGVNWLVEQGLADPERTGIYGWSYGGFMAAMALARAPETFAAAVVGAPVTAWDGYDTHYTERYMGTPQTNAAGYEESSVMKYVPQMRGKLMLIHGLIDENVHFRHTARLINALIAARKTYDLLLFPDERHSPRRQGDRVFMEEQIVNFFKRTLMA